MRVLLPGLLLLPLWACTGNDKSDDPGADSGAGDGGSSSDGGGSAPDPTCQRVPDGLDLTSTDGGFLYAGQILDFCIGLDDDYGTLVPLANFPPPAMLAA